MEDKPFIPDAYCGLYCAACPQYIETQKNTLEEDSGIQCRGCKSGTVAEWCVSCSLKSCAKEKGHDFCFQCSDYPCTQLKNFKIDPLYPYHSEVFDYMKTIEEDGKSSWLNQMKKRWQCSNCKTSFNWWTTLCPECENKVSGYTKPE